MAYTKKTWVKGSTPLSAENFNHMEQGIEDAHADIAQLNSEIGNLHLKTIKISGTSDSNGLLWQGGTGIDLNSVKLIDCVSNTFSKGSLPFGLIILDGIEGNVLRFRLVATNNTVFANYTINKNIILIYQI